MTFRALVAYQFLQNDSGNKVISGSFEICAGEKERLVDALVEKLYGTMKDSDAGRANQTVELIVDREPTAASKFKAFLDDLWQRRVSNLAA